MSSSNSETHQHSNLLFVYGHLRRGDCAEHLVANFPFEGDVRTAAGYRMLACAGGEYPGLVVDAAAAGAILGELRLVDKLESWAAMDEYEDVAGGTYARELITLADGREVQAYLYLGEDRGELADAGDDWLTSDLRKKPQCE